MSRRQAREQAFALLFEKCFNDRPVEELVADAAEARDLQPDAFALQLATGAEAQLAAIDEHIEKNADKWSKDRLSRVALSVLRLAVYEMLYCDETTVSVAINEAVELAKKYGGEEDASFINGVLGGISRRAV
jgi:N utilization substance protein B